MAELIGALLMTYFLTRAINRLVKNWMNPIIAALFASFLVAALALVITSFTMGIEKGIMLYIPCLLMWLAIDIVRSKRRHDSPPTTNTIDTINEERATK